MIRLLPFILALALGIAGAVWFAERPGEVSLNWMGYRMDAPIWVLVAALTLIVVVFAALYRLWIGLIRLPARVRAARATARRQRGELAFSQGMAAIAAGEAAEAKRLARRAGDLLKAQPLTLLLAAQAAQLNGDEAGAEANYTAMLEIPEIAFLGARGLYAQARRGGNRELALKYARQAQALKPGAPWAATTLFEIETEGRDWRAAIATLDSAGKRKLVDSDSVRRRKAVILAEQAGERLADADMAGVLECAREAHKLAPRLVAATVLLARALTAKGRARAATRIVEEAWLRAPHPELARAYADIHPDETALARAERFEKLARANPQHEESHLALAAAALAAELWGEARAHLATLVNGGGAPSDGRAYRLMAALEEGENGDVTAARDWLRRAADAGASAVWLCSNCGAIAAQWQALCGQCGVFDSLEWSRPGMARLTAPPA